MLGRISRLAIGREGRVAAIEVQRPNPAPRKPERYEGLNLSLRVGEVRPAWQWSLLGIGRYVAASGDQREGLIQVAISSALGTVVALPELSSLCFEPMAYFFSTSCHGSATNCFMPSDIFLSSLSKDKITASTSSLTLRKS